MSLISLLIAASLCWVQHADPGTILEEGATPLIIKTERVSTVAIPGEGNALVQIVEFSWVYSHDDAEYGSWEEGYFVYTVNTEFWRSTVFENNKTYYVGLTINGGSPYLVRQHHVLELEDDEGVADFTQRIAQAYNDQGKIDDE